MSLEVHFTCVLCWIKIYVDIYDKLLEAKIEADEKSPTLTIEDYRAEKHLQKPTMQKFLYSNAFRFIIFIPLFVILTENAWDVATGRFPERLKF